MQTPAVRERMVSGLMNVAPELAEAVAEGLGMAAMPEPMPKVLQKAVKPEVAKSPALSLLARPGDGSIRARRVAILVADGVASAELRSLADALTTRAPCRDSSAPRLGAVAGAGGDPIEVDVTVEAMPSVLFDAVVLPDGDAAVRALVGRRPRARVRQGPVPPLQADPGARRRIGSRSSARASPARCRRASPIPVC